MVTNATITIFNRIPDKVSKKFVYVPHAIQRVWFHTKQKSSVGENGLKSADGYQIRIPYSECENWLPSDEFLKSETPSQNWTVQNGDLFIVGTWSGADRVSGINEIEKEFSGVTGEVLNHSENFFGSSKHIRIGGGS